MANGKEWVLERRARILAGHLAALIPHGGHVLDVANGDSKVDRFISSPQPYVKIQGINIWARPLTSFPVRRFDGKSTPFGEQCFDVLHFVDALQHIPDQPVQLGEAKRVGQAILIKDHYQEGYWPSQLRFMGWVGNARHGVALPYNDWSRARRAAAFQ